MKSKNIISRVDSSLLLQMKTFDTGKKVLNLTEEILNYYNKYINNAEVILKQRNGGHEICCLIELHWDLFHEKGGSDHNILRFLQSFRNFYFTPDVFFDSNLQEHGKAIIDYTVPSMEHGGSLGRISKRMEVQSVEDAINCGKKWLKTVKKSFNDSKKHEGIYYKILKSNLVIVDGKTVKDRYNKPEVKNFNFGFNDVDNKYSIVLWDEDNKVLQLTSK